MIKAQVRLLRPCDSEDTCCSAAATSQCTVCEIGGRKYVNPSAYLLPKLMCVLTLNY